jgi:hypothetical protein
MKSFLQECIWTMDMIHGSAGNFCAHFMKIVRKTQIMGTLVLYLTA